MTRLQPIHIPLFAVVSVLVLGACATTKLESTLNPDVTARRFERVMVWFPVLQVEARELFETTFAEESNDGTTFIPSYPVMIQGNEYSDAEVAEIIETHEIDAVLRLSVTDQGHETSHTPYGQVKNPNAGFEVVLISVEEGVVIWSSTAETQGNWLADRDDLLRSLARKIIEQLEKDGLIY